MDGVQILAVFAISLDKSTPQVIEMSDRDKFLTEVIGGCDHDWHKRKGFTQGHHCTKCGKYWPVKPESPIGVVDFSTWEGFGKLWEWSKDQKWFCLMMAHNDCGPHDIVNPYLFANEVYKFLTREADKP